MKKSVRKLVKMTHNNKTAALAVAAVAVPLLGTAGLVRADAPPPAAALSQASPETLLKWADADRSKGQCSVAIGLYTQVLQNSPQNAAALMGRGKAYLARREFAAALTDYNKAVEAAPTADAFYGRAIVRLMMQEQAEQEAAIRAGGEAAIAGSGGITPVPPAPPLCAVVDVAAQTKQTDLILADLNKAAELKPNLASLWFRKAAVCEAAGRTNEARAAYQTFLARSSDKNSVAKTQAQARLAVLTAK